MNGCGCEAGNAAIGSAGPQAVLPLNAILSPQLTGAVAAAPVGRSMQIAHSPSLAATAESQQAAQAEIFQVHGGAVQPRKPPSKLTGKTWLVIIGVAAAAFAALV